MPGALRAVAQAWMRQPSCIVAGHTEIFCGTGVTEVVKARDQSLRNFIRFWESDTFGWTQQGTFVPLADLKAIGGVREELVYCMDYQMMVRLLMRDIPVVYLTSPWPGFAFTPIPRRWVPRKNSVWNECRCCGRSNPCRCRCRTGNGMPNRRGVWWMWPVMRGVRRAVCGPLAC